MTPSQGPAPARPADPVARGVDAGAPDLPEATALAVLGLIANSDLSAFTRLAADAEVAPTVADRIELCRIAGAAAERLARVEARTAEVGADLADVVAPYLGTFTDFDARTPPTTWWERLLKAHVGFGVEDDVARLLATGLAERDEATRGLVLAVLDDDRHERFVVARVTEATAGDPVLASRLALWGRRLVGEALGVVQRLIADHPELRALLERAMPEDGSGAPLQQRLFSVLTSEHARRMDRLGLTA